MREDINENGQTTDMAMEEKLEDQKPSSQPQDSLGLQLCKRKEMAIIYIANFW